MVAAKAGYAVFQRDALKEIFNATDEETLKKIDRHPERKLVQRHVISHDGRL